MRLGLRAPFSKEPQCTSEGAEAGESSFEFCFLILSNVIFLMFVFLSTR